MKTLFGQFSDDDVQQIAKLVEKLEQSKFDYLRLELGDLKLIVSKGSHVEAIATDANTSLLQPQSVSPPAPAVTPAVPSLPAQQATDQASASRDASQGETVPIRAPMVGRFYSRPEPGAPPFVTEGSEVDEDTTVGLIEVMKVFTAVRAGVRGVISEVCVQDAEFVEYGQTLFWVRLTKPAAR